MNIERKKRTPKQIIAALNRRKEYLECFINLEKDLKGQNFIQVLAKNTAENRKRWPNGKQYDYSRSFWIVDYFRVYPYHLKKQKGKNNKIYMDIVKELLKSLREYRDNGVPKWYYKTPRAVWMAILDRLDYGCEKEEIVDLEINILELIIKSGIDKESDYNIFESIQPPTGDHDLIKWRDDAINATLEALEKFSD